MADLAAAAVEILDEWYEDGLAGNMYIARKFRLILTGQGGTTNTIPASVLQLGTIVSAGSAIANDNTEVITCVPSYDQSFLIFGDGASNAPADQTGMFDVIVRGTRTV